MLQEIGEGGHPERGADPHATILIRGHVLDESTVAVLACGVVLRYGRARPRCQRDCPMSHPSLPRLLLTPGPLTTSAHTRAAMDRDWGSREPDFVMLSESVRARLAGLANVADTHVAVPVQGSGTFAIEAAVQTLVPRDATLLVLVNGAYGRRIAAIAGRLGRRVHMLEIPEDRAFEPEIVGSALDANPSVTDVALVHCETTSGLLNPLPALAAVIRAAKRRLLLDAMSSFGAIPIDGAATPFTALVASSGKALESVPGLGFVLAERAHLQNCAHVASSLSLDLHEQWRGFEADGQWRFTPPVQIVAALSAALDQLDAEGGVQARHARYTRNRDLLVSGMRAHGFKPYLDPALQAPVIVTFRIPDGDWFRAGSFHDALQARGIVIYPGKLTQAPSFRIGCIGAVGEREMRRVLDAVGVFMAEAVRA